MDRAKLKAKLSLKKKKPSSSSSGGNEKNAKINRGRRAALTAPFGNSKTDKTQMKQYLASIESGNSAKIGELLEGGLDLHEIDEDSESLRFACRRGHMEIVAVLLRYGAEINRLGEDESDSPIHIATRLGNGGLVALLLSQGAAVNLQSKFEKKTALHVAVLHGKEHIARLLLENNADLEQGDIYGTTPLHIAARMANLPTLEVLIHFKPNINAYDNDGWTALHLAADSGNIAVARMLLDQHSQVDCQNKYGRTPLHWACSKGHFTMMKLLLDYKADIGLKDLHGKCALDYATSKEMKSVLEKKTDGFEEKPVGEPGHSIGKYIIIDPRESMLRKVYEESVETKKNKVDIPVILSPNVPTIMETENEYLPTVAHRSVSSKGSNKRTDVDEVFVDHDGIEDTESVCVSIESFPMREYSVKAIRTISDSTSDNKPPLKGVRIQRLNTRSSSNGSFSTIRSGSSDAQSSSSGPLAEGKGILRKLTKSISAQNEHLRKEIRFMYNTVSKSILSSSEEKYLESLKSAKARLELMENKIFDFQEETEVLTKKMKLKMNCIYDESTAKPSTPEELSPTFYIALFHAIGSYIGKNTGLWKNVAKGLGKGSVEHEYDIEKSIHDAGNSESEKIDRCMDYIVQREVTNEAPFLKDQLDFIIVTCSFGEEARTLILYEFINSLTSNEPSEITTGQMFSLSEKLREEGEALALPLGLAGKDLENKDWNSAPHSSNMEMFALWHDRTLALSTLGRICQMTGALMDIGREDLLAVVFQLQ